MKALTLYEPWASLVAFGHKANETRSWKAPHSAIGQRIAIHAAKTAEHCLLIGPLSKRAGWTEDEFHSHLISVGTDPYGKILAVATLEACRRVEEVRDVLSDQERAFGDYSNGRFAWILRDVARLQGPLTIRGMQGLWKVPLSFEDELLRRIA